MSEDPDSRQEERSQLVAELRADNVAGSRVLGVLERVPRHAFVPDHLADQAYDNRALKIGEGQTISQPTVVAMMTESLGLAGCEKVLEIGTGSGYQAAVLAELAREVHTVERLEGLYEKARERLARLGYSNVTCHLGDGSAGLPEEAPFDAICVTAASPDVPEPLRNQLAPGGRLVIPIGGKRRQVLRALVLSSEGERTSDESGVVFVPLIGEHAWPEEDEPY